MTKSKWTLASVATILGIVVAVPAAIGVITSYAPWAPEEKVEYLTKKMVRLDIRSLRWQLESLKRQRYDARRACRRGDVDACDHVKDLTREIINIQNLLRKARGS